MEETKTSGFERLSGRLAALASAYRVPLLSGLIAGFLAHGFAMANKLLNADEVGSLFAKGETVISGRWALGLTRYLFPNVSMPWVYGLLSILMLSVAMCLIVRIFQIRSKLLQGILAALVISFPSQTATFCFMFTSPSYALAFLLAVLAVYLTEKEDWRNRILGLGILVISLGIYQAYIALVAGFFVIRMIQKLLRGETPQAVFRYGLLRAAFLLAALLIYYGIALAAVSLDGRGFVSYAVERERGIFYRIALAYSALLRSFTRGYFGFVRSAYSLLVHAVCLALSLVLLLRWWLKHREAARTALLLLCLALLPLAINCMYLIASVTVIYSPVLYSFSALYVLAAVIAEETRDSDRGLVRDLLAVCLSLVTLCNVYYANKVYLKMYLDYENAYSLYSGIAAQVRMTEGFDENSTLAFIGEAENGLFYDERLDLGDLGGPNQNLINIYTKEYLLRRYVGFDVPMADEETCLALGRDPRVQEMPAYPYYGSVQKIDHYIVVKLG